MWPSDPIADALVEGYIAWHEASADLREAHRLCLECSWPDRQLACAGYLAALDREQKAADVYADVIRVVREQRAGRPD